MRKSSLIYLAVLALQAVPSIAQRLGISLPANKGRSLVVTLKHGTQADTVYNARLDTAGYAEVIIPDQYRDYCGMANLKAGDYAAFDFIIAGEDFNLTCTDEYPHGGNVFFSGSPENESLQRWFFTQQKRREKIGLLSEVLRLYDKGDVFRPSLEKERALLEEQQRTFEGSLGKSPLYAARFMCYHNYVHNQIAGLLFADSLQMSQVRSYVRDSLDINGLFTSGLWFDTLNGLLALYDNGTPYHKDFITDMSILLERSATDRIYATLADNLFTICERMGWNDLEEQLAYYLVNSERIKTPKGRLKKLMTLFRLVKGSKAPALTQAGAKPFRAKTLLVFYESGCNACENELWQLKANYPLIRQNGYEVVSISADKNATVFKNTTAGFPWKAKYCDMAGFTGKDFTNFGVIGTPTFYLIDRKGIIQGRYAKLSDTGLVK
jgi:hypothetical protein